MSKKSAAARKGSAAECSSMDKNVKETCNFCGNFEAGDSTQEVKWIKCDICEKWFHIFCVGVDEEQFDCINRLSKRGHNIHWFCEECNSPTIDMLKIIKEIQSKNERLEKNFLSVKTEVGSLSKKLNEGLNHLSGRLDNYQAELKVFENTMKVIENKFNDKMNETNNKLAESVDQHLQTKIADLDNKWAQVVQTTKQVECKISGVQNTLGEVKKQADEERDKESRAGNIIIFNVSESNNEDIEARPRDDKKFCLEVFNKVLNLAVVPEDIKINFRLGKRNDSDSINRPLLLQFRDRIFKNMVMDSLSKLKHADAAYQNLIFSYDMTHNERDQCRKMVAEAKKREQDDESGEFIYRVRGFPGKHHIVKIKKVILEEVNPQN